MHDHSIGIVAAQSGKDSTEELPVIDRLSALTVAIIKKDEPNAMHSVAVLVSVAALLARHSVGVSYLGAR